MNNSLHLKLKYTRMFVRRRHLFRDANRFPRASLEENCDNTVTNCKFRFSQCNIYPSTQGLHTNQVAYQAGAYPGFCSMK